MHHVGALSVVKISVLPELTHRFDKVPLESQPSFSMLTGNGAVTHTGKAKEPGYLVIRRQVHTNACTQMFTAALFKTDNS